jgi:hypothetical protein
MNDDGVSLCQWMHSSVLLSRVQLASHVLHRQEHAGSWFVRFYVMCL